MSPYPCLISIKYAAWTPQYPNLSTEKMIQIGSVVSEMQPVNVKSWGHVQSSRHVYSAKYGIIASAGRSNTEAEKLLIIDTHISLYT